MTKIEFDDVFRRLERLYAKGGESLEEKTRAEYFDAVRYFHIEILERAVNYIRETHRIKAIPTPAEILDAIGEVNKNTPRATMEELALRCGKCDNDGWSIDNPLGPEGKKINAGVARYCDCRLGQQKKKLHLQRGMGEMGPVTWEKQRKEKSGFTPIKSIRYNPSGLDNEDSDVPF